LWLPVACFHAPRFIVVFSRYVHSISVNHVPVEAS
jgi:hypothetical protein